MMEAVRQVRSVGVDASAWRRPRNLFKSQASQPNLLVRWAFYVSVFAMPFAHLYLPGTGDRLGVKRVIQVLMVAAMVSRPRVCIRLIPIALLWFTAYCGLRIIFGLWLAPEYSSLWWPNSLELLQFLLPWALLLFNTLQYREFKLGGLWALVLGTSLCAMLHVLGIGTVEIDNGIDGRSSIFGQNANEIGETY